MLHPAKPVCRCSPDARLIVVQQRDQSLGGLSIGNGAEQFRGGDANPDIIGL